jgi:polyhydroxyalkanoate synthase
MLPTRTAHDANASAGPPDESFERDSFAATAWADIVDRSMHAATARFTAGLSPIAFADAYLDWAAHLAFLPGKRFRLIEKAAKKIARLANYAARCAIGGVAPCIVPLPQDHRFDDPG